MRFDFGVSHGNAVHGNALHGNALNTIVAKIISNGDIQQQNSITKNIIIDHISFVTFSDGSFTHLKVCVLTYLAGDCATFNSPHDNHVVCD